MQEVIIQLIQVNPWAAAFAIVGMASAIAFGVYCMARSVSGGWK